MLANIVIRTSLLIDPGKALKSGVGLVFLVEAPAYSLILKQVDHR